MSSITIRCPYCLSAQTVSTPIDFKPFYLDCPDCSKRFIAEPARNGISVFRDGEAPCCSDPDCRELELGDSGQD